MKYRKKPVVIEAMQWDGTRAGVDNIRAWAPKLETISLITNQIGEVTEWRIGTLEGGHSVSRFDFIIQGVAGEFYPRKAGIFAQTYDAVTD